MRPAIAVLGSLNMDFVVTVRELPARGETALGGDFRMIPGGKGANQACAVGRLGGSAVAARMIGRVGYDLFADQLRASLSAAGVDVNGVISTESQPTGVALITVDGEGGNTIVVASGANYQIAASEVAGFRKNFEGARFVLFQLETPLPAVRAALRMARSLGASAILDPAPAQPLETGLLAEVDVLTPNETEACILLGRRPGNITIEEAGEVTEALLALGPKAAVLKLGAQGCFYRDSARALHVPGFVVDAKDTTAAGDTFNAALAVGLAEDRPVEEALRFANAAAALSVTRIGAQASIPSRADTLEFLARK